MITGATLVYDATHTGSLASAWNEFILSSTFDVDDGLGVLVLVERNFGGSGSSDAGNNSAGPGVYYTSVTGAHQYWNADSTPPTGTGSVTAARPNITITYTPYTVTGPPNPYSSGIPANNATE
jgi:hypothetical protein